MDSLLSCSLDVGAKQALTSTITGTMTDNGDGTYSFSYTTQQSGEITVYIYLEDAPGAYVEFFSNFFWFGNPYKYEFIDNINFDWSTGDVFATYSNCLTAKFYAKLLAPFTGSYDIYMKHNDGSRLYFDSVEKINQIGTQCT